MNLKALFLIPLLLLSSLSWAVDTGSITLSGAVQPVTLINVTNVPGYNSLDLSATTSDLTVATVREINNTLVGYAVTLTSINSGELQNGADFIVYTAKYDGISVVLSSTPVTVTSQSSQSGIVNTVKDFDISYTGITVENYMAGTYTDTLTFTITAN